MPEIPSQTELGKQEKAHYSFRMMEKRMQAQGYFKKHFGGKYGPETIEDFGSYCSLEWAKGRSLETHLKHLAIDFLRTFTQHKGQGSKSALSMAQKAIEDVPGGQLKCSSQDLERFLSRSVLRDSRLEKQQRMILILYFEWGFKLSEIGDLLNLSKPRIGNLLSEAISRVRALFFEDLSQENRSLPTTTSSLSERLS